MEGALQPDDTEGMTFWNPALPLPALDAGDLRARLRRLPWLVMAALAVVYCVWGATVLAISVAVHSLPPLLLISTRCLMAGLARLGVVLVRERAARARQQRTRASLAAGARRWGAVVPTALCMVVVGMGGSAWSEQTVPSGVAALMMSMSAIWIALLGWPVQGERIARTTAGGIALGVVGVGVLVIPG